jgi:uncharacterized RDD family membrane protein YckC
MASAPLTGHSAATARAQASARRVHGVQPSDAGGGSPYVGFVTRFIAFAVDAAIINVVAILVAAAVALILSILPESGTREDIVKVVGSVAFGLWVIAYFVFFWTGTGETPGNRLLRIAVRRADGTPLRPRHALVRLVGVVLSAPLLIGFLPILVTDRRRGLPDWMAGTVVVAASAERDDSGDSRAPAAF